MLTPAGTAARTSNVGVCFAVCFFALAVLADLTVTAVALGSVDGISEGNPVLARWFASYGVWPTSIAVVCVSCIVSAGVIALCREARSALITRAAGITLAGVGLLRWSVVAANVALLARH